MNELRIGGNNSALKVSWPYPQTPAVGSANIAAVLVEPTAADRQRRYECLTKLRQVPFAFLKLEEQGFQVHLLLVESWVRRAGQWIKKQDVMFPRHALLRPEGASQSVSPVRNTPGAATLVRLGPVLAQMLIHRLADLQATLTVRAPSWSLRPGQQVVLALRSLKGLAAIVSTSESDRASMLLALLGQEQTVAIPIGDLTFA